MKTDFTSEQSELILNPKLPAQQSELHQKNWQAWLQGQADVAEKSGFIGIATSGTTGEPKLVVLKKTAIIASARFANAALKAGRDDVWYKTLPSFHVGGLGILARASVAGATVIEANSVQWSPEKVAAEMREHQATLVSLVPTQLFDFVTKRISAPSSIREVILGGGKADEDLLLRARELGWPLRVSYGMSETASMIALSNFAESRLQVLAGHEVRVSLDGYLEVQSPALFSGYILSNGQYRPHQTGSWFKTEDKANVDGSHLSILGRGADFVKILGENVSLVDLRELWRSCCPELVNASELVAVPNARSGYEIGLVYEGSSRFDAESGLNQAVAEFNARVLPVARISKRMVVESLPRTALGKVQVPELLGFFTKHQES